MKIFGPYKTKRASMQLSINAIVILVMAMAVLGLGLAMVRGLLGDGVDRLETAIDSVDLTEEASSGKPLAGTNAIRIQRDSSQPIAVSFYNTDSSSCADEGAFMKIECTDDQMWDLTAEDADGEQPVSVNVPIGSSSRVGGIYRTENTAGTYGCTVNIYCDGNINNPASNPVESTTAFIEVTS